MEILFKWDEEKNAKLVRVRGISFQEVVLCIEDDQVLEVIDNPNKEKYEHQRVFVVKVRDYVYLVPFVDNGEEMFLKTIIPSRKWTKKYLKRGG